MAVIELYELEDYMQRSFAGKDVTAASVIVDYVQSDLEVWLGRSLEIANHSESNIPIYPGQNFLSLTYTPVNEVTHLEVDGAAWVPGAWALERSGVWLYSIATVVTGLEANEVSLANVEYSAGLGEPAVSAAKFTIIQRAARLLEKADEDELGLESISVEGYSARWYGEGFSDEELKIMRRYKRRVTSTPPWPQDFPLTQLSSWQVY